MIGVSISPLPAAPGSRLGNSLPPQCVQGLEPVVSDDALLIEQALAGKSAAFGQLVQKYQDRLYNTVVHVTGCAEDARDVVQEAFVQAYLKLETFQRTCAFYTWLYRIAFNIAASHRRRRRPLVSVEHTRELTGEEPLDLRPGPEHRLEQAERCRQVREAIATLSEEHRAIVVLREIDGCCYETIAEVLDLPIGTVRSRLHRARLQLREQLRQVMILEE
jgi:RNA polymerase sigma-70 factor, ECF subfamily